MPDKNIIKKNALSPTVLIAGGAGFIGSHLAEALLKKNARVVVIDNFSTGKDVYVHNLLDNPKFALFNVDINYGIPSEIESVDYIFHLASLETYLFDKNDLSLESLLTNALGTKNVLDFAKKSDAKFLMASTLDIYKGIISPLNLDQYFGETPADERKYSLIEAKRYAEALVWEYYKKHSLDVRVARFPEVYGPRMNALSSGSLGLLVQALVDHQDLVVHGEGNEKESYVYIADAVSGLIKALFSEHTKGKIFTFSGGETHTVLETTYLVKSLANSEVRVVFKPKDTSYSTLEPHVPDQTNLKDLNWEEKVSFREGIMETLKWFGYEPNEFAFKPLKIIENKKKEKASSKPSIFSLVDFHKHVPEVAPVPAPSLMIHPEASDRDTPVQNIPMPVFKKQKKTQSPNLLPNNASKKTRRFNTWRLLSICTVFLVLVTVFIGIPFLQTYIHARAGVTALGEVKNNLGTLNTTTAQENANTAFREFYSAKASLSRVSWLFSIAGQREYFNDTQNLFSSASNASKAVYFVAKGATPYVNFWHALKPNSTDTFDKEAFNSSKADFVNAQNNLRLAEAELKQVDFNKFPAKVGEYYALISKTSTDLDLLVSVSAGMADLAGLEGTRKYLILLQNSNEIRPTGGFIGSYAVLELSNGKISDLLIDDIYNPDGQIDLREIAVEPPAPIKDYLGEDVLHIRNANWDPDFVMSSTQIEELFFKLDGREFDGVIALDLSFVEYLMQVTGPVYLTAYNEEISAENLYERTQFHSEFNYEDGSDQKRSFLTVLGGKLLERLFALDQHDLVKLSEVATKSLNEKHLLINISQNPMNSYIAQRGWNGQLKDVQDDYLYVVNANVGGTKANYFVKNDMQYKVSSDTRDGLLRGELSLTYKHTGTDTAWPGGPYTNYLRVLTQYGATLTGAKLSVNNKQPVDIFNLVTIGKEGKYTSFEFPFVIDPQDEAVVTFNYDLPKALSLTKDLSSYNLFWQKQPGTRNDTFGFSFDVPFGTRVVATKPSLDVLNTSVTTSGQLITDLPIFIDLD